MGIPYMFSLGKTCLTLSSMLGGGGDYFFTRFLGIKELFSLTV